MDKKDVVLPLVKLRLDSGTGPDQILTILLRHCVAYIVDPVSFICNMIWTNVAGLRRGETIKFANSTRKNEKLTLAITNA